MSDSDSSLRKTLAEVGKRVMDRQPDEIHLALNASYEWRDRQAMQLCVDPLLANGFQAIGTYSVHPLPGVIVCLLVKESYRMYSIIYEHPKAGVWMNFVCLYEDGGSVTFTTSRDRGLEQRPAHPILHVPGATAQELYEQALRERPQGNLKMLSKMSVVGEFEKAYLDSSRWRKGKGLSTQEIVKVAASRTVTGTEQRTIRKIKFVAEQDGVPERELKSRLAKVFDDNQGILAGYLTRARYEDFPETHVALCLVSQRPNDPQLVAKIRDHFATLFKNGGHLDILFLHENQVAVVESVCKPFYKRDRPLS